MAVAIGIGAILVAPYAFRWLATIGAVFFASTISISVATAGWHRLSGVIGATLLVIAIACIGLYVLARMGRVVEFEGRRLVGAIVATLILGAMAIGFGGIGTVFGFGRLLPLPEDPTAGDELLAFSSTIVTAVGVVALGFLAFLWLIRPYAIDED